MTGEIRKKLVFPESPALAGAREYLLTLNRAGHTACLVGGCVRDALLGRPCHDADLVTSAVPEEVMKLLPCARPAGAAFGVLLLPLPDGGYVELASMREERFYLDGRHPSEIKYTKDPALDAKRRDFTVNSLYYDPFRQEVRDFTGGLEDLDRGILRTVGDARERFGEDYLRMFRAARFAAELQLTPDKQIPEAIRHCAPLVRQLAVERIRTEMDRMLAGPRSRIAMQYLSEWGLLKEFLIEVEQLHGVRQNPVFHPEGDVWTHTMLMLDHKAAGDPRLGWSVLLHDVGKPGTASVAENGDVHFYSHELLGSQMAEGILDRLRFSRADRDAILQAVGGHMRFAAVPQMKDTTRRKMIARENFALELELNRLDCLSCHGLLEAFVQLLDDCRTLPERQLPPPFLKGRDLLALGLKPSPEFKAILDRYYERQIAGEFPGREEALRFLASEFSR